MMWNPWRGCHRYSEGCKYCYIHKGDAKRGMDTNNIVKSKNFDAPIAKNKNGEYKMKSGKLVYVCFSSDFLLEDADDRLRSFYIGYFTHLMVDRLWSDKIVVPTVQKHQEEFLKNHALLDKVNNDWYALDYYFLKMNPHFSMLEKLKDIQTFKNDYIDFLSDECLEKLIRNVNHLYQNIHAPKDSQMEYLSGEELEKFIEFAIRQITLEMIHKGIMCDGGCV